MKHIFAVTKGYLALLLALMVVSVWVLVLGSRPVSSEQKPVRVAIPRGASAKEIGTVLRDRGLIRSQFVFVLTCRMSGLSGKLKPGVYELDQSMAVPVIIRKLVDGNSLAAWIVVPEGYTARQIADVLQDRQIARADSFLRQAIGGGRSYSQYPFIAGDSLEGYLFPDSYLIARGSRPNVVIEKMLDTFEKRVVRDNAAEIDRVIRKRFAGSSSADGLFKLLTVASLIEREAKVAKDRRLISAVLYNRLAKGMRLEIDATISYVPGDSRGNKDTVNYDDLETGSPYNTYRHGGLPPGPICNPGLEAIKAAMDPANADYLFYVARADGSHVFSRTLAEHNKAKRAIKREAGSG